MKKKIIHTIAFEIKQNGKSLFKTDPIAFGSPAEKESAGNVLKELKTTYSSEIYSISKFITDTEIREYSVK